MEVTLFYISFSIIFYSVAISINRRLISTLNLRSKDVSEYVLKLEMEN